MKQLGGLIRWSGMDRKQLVSRILAKAQKYSSYKSWIGDGETAQGITALSEKLQLRASALAKRTENRVRRRAREIWQENGRPSGRDEEFWLQAEREFREAENLTAQVDAANGSSARRRSEASSS
jgi:hypothetical protein